MNKNAWLIYNGIDDGCPPCGLTLICLDETDALETFMALVEEEMYETFYCMCQDELEDVETLPLSAVGTKYWDTLWYVMEVPIIYGDSCGEELSKPTRG